MEQFDFQSFKGLSVFDILISTGAGDVPSKSDSGGLHHMSAPVITVSSLPTKRYIHPRCVPDPRVTERHSRIPYVDLDGRPFSPFHCLRTRRGFTTAHVCALRFRDGVTSNEADPAVEECRGIGARESAISKGKGVSLIDV